MSNDTRTISLTDFLLARIAEDEARAYEIHNQLDCDAAFPCVCGYPARIAAECDAWRAAAMIHTPKYEPFGMGTYDCPMCAEGWEDLTTGDAGHYPVTYPCLTLRNLALPYAGHPDYREDFRP